jgi:hypothetical protein
VDLLALRSPAPEPPTDVPLLTGAADLQEATPSPVTWPQPALAPACPAPHPPRGKPYSTPSHRSTIPRARRRNGRRDRRLAGRAVRLGERHRRYLPRPASGRRKAVRVLVFEPRPNGQGGHHVAIEGPSGSRPDFAALALLSGATLPAPPAA